MPNKNFNIKGKPVMIAAGAIALIVLGTVAVTAISRNTSGKDESVTISLDEKKLKNADIAVVKSIFDGSSSYGQTVATQASSIKNYAASQLSKLAATGIYTNNGSYNYASGSVYSTYL